MRRAAIKGALNRLSGFHMIVKGIFLPQMMVINFQVWDGLSLASRRGPRWARPYQPDVMGIGIRAQSESQCQGFNRGPTMAIHYSLGFSYTHH